MANKPTKPNFPLGLESQDQSVFQEGILNNGVVEHGPDAVMTVPETPDASGVPSAVRYNEDDDQFEGFYNEGGWLPLGGGNGGRWELLPYASSTLLQAGRAYLVDNTDGVSTVLFPSPKRIGDSVTVCDLYGKFSTYPLTVDGNGKSIYGSADSMTISTDNVSATFTWTGEARGWVITSGVGLGQGRVYSREIYSQILSATTPSIILSTQPSIVDVYVDGKRLKESLYTLDGYEVKFDPALASGSDVQIIQYIPIQLGAGGGGSGGTVITWEYNGGSAIGGETQIVLDVVVDSVSEIYIRGSRQQIGRGFTFDPATSTITLADELEAGDDVVVVINGDPTVYNQIDRTPWEVARSNNVKNSEVILSTDKQSVLDGKTVIFDVNSQISWSLPAGIPAGSKITSLTGNILICNPGNINVSLTQLMDINGQINVMNLPGKGGFMQIGRCSDLSVLRTIEPKIPGSMISVVSHSAGWATNINPIGGGWFVYDAADVTTADDNGSCVVTLGGKRWKRMRESAIISLAEYGIAPGSGADISTALQAAINWSRANDITTITIPASRTPYVMTKSVSADTTNTPIEILGGSGKNMDEVTIEHYYDSAAGTTWAIKFFNTVAGAPCWKSAKSSGIYAYCMDSINPLHFYRFNDGWRNELTNFHAHGYIKSSAFVLCNDISWTENFYCENLNIRHCKSMCQLYTNSAWHSFYGFTARNIFFNHGNLVGGPSDAIVLGTGTEPGRAFLYAADIDIGGWLGTVYPGQPHTGIRVRQYSSLVESKVTSRYDGVSSPNLGNNFRMFVTDNVNAMVDVEYINHNNQYGYIEGAFSMPASGSTVTARLWDNLAYPTNDGSTYTQGRCTFGNSPWGARCPIRLRGAKMVYRTSLISSADPVTAAGIIRVEGLPVLSSFIIELRVNGPNHSNAQRFLVTTQNQDYIASVQRQDSLIASTAVNSIFNSATNTVTSTAETTLSPNNTFSNNGLYVRTYNNIQAGTYNAGQGCKIDIMIPPSLYRGVANNNGTPVDGNNYGIEIEIIQL